jgi:dipeptidyl aminopeptidase/acylaminoacyl peptidase
LGWNIPGPAVQMPRLCGTVLIMGFDLNRLLDIRLYQAFDADESGRVLAGSDDSGSTQLIEISADGSTVPLTALPGACAGHYLPGRRTVIVSHDDGGNERHQLSLLRLPREAPAGLADLTPLVHDPRYIHSLAAIAGDRICYFTNRRNGIAFDPVIRELPAGDETSGSERALVLGDHRFAEAALSPDGRWLALTVSSPVTAASEHVVLVNLAVAPGQEAMRAITTQDAPAMNEALAWAPGSDALIFSSNNDREFTAVTRYDLATGELTVLVADEEADLTGWLSPDGALLLVERDDDGASVLTLHDAATGAHLHDVPMPDAGTIVSVRFPYPHWAPGSRTVALSISSPDFPGDALLLDVTTRGLTSLTHSARVLSGPDGGHVPIKPEQHRIPTPDGELVPCRVYRSQTEGTSAVVVVHGGPEGQARQNFDTVVQALAAQGHTVLVPNVRGSTGYGKRWYSADDVRKRLDSVRDLAAIHTYLPKLGVDQSRAALWGGSYGGYMVLAGLAFQPSLWAAGVDIVGIASLVTFLENTSAYRRAYREREYGSLANDRDFLHEVSPLTHIDDIIAPLFIIHGANDPRVPLSEAEQIHAAMTSRGRECELLVYGDEGHGLSKRSSRADAIPKAFAFLARHLASQ